MCVCLHNTDKNNLLKITNNNAKVAVMIISGAVQKVCNNKFGTFDPQTPVTNPRPPITSRSQNCDPT